MSESSESGLTFELLYKAYNEGFYASYDDEDLYFVDSINAGVDIDNKFIYDIRFERKFYFDDYNKTWSLSKDMLYEYLKSDYNDAKDDYAIYEDTEFDDGLDSTSFKCIVQDVTKRRIDDIVKALNLNADKHTMYRGVKVRKDN